MEGIEKIRFLFFFNFLLVSGGSGGAAVQLFFTRK